MKIIIAKFSHIKYANDVCQTIENAAKHRGTGIAKRTPEYIISKIKQENAVIALDEEQFVGFCYIETWSHNRFVANSGLIVHPDYRGLGIGKKIKRKIFEHSREKYPKAKIFGITTGLAVMKMNSDLGYNPVTFSELTKDQDFWNGCQTCKNYDVLQRTNQSMCLCTAMLYDPDKQTTEKKTVKANVFRRLKNIKQSLLMKKNEKNSNCL